MKQSRCLKEADKKTSKEARRRRRGRKKGVKWRGE
jgi:hypothetical protein